jgi:hypothetical protein
MGESFLLSVSENGSGGNRGAQPTHLLRDLAQNGLQGRVQVRFRDGVDLFRKSD